MHQIPSPLQFGKIFNRANEEEGEEIEHSKDGRQDEVNSYFAKESWGGVHFDGGTAKMCPGGEVLREYVSRPFVGMVDGDCSETERQEAHNERKHPSKEHSWNGEECRSEWPKILHKIKAMNLHDKI
jgi:hypothetical protein